MITRGSHLGLRRRHSRQARSRESVGGTDQTSSRRRGDCVQGDTSTWLMLKPQLLVARETTEKSGLRCLGAVALKQLNSAGL